MSDCVNLPKMVYADCAASAPILPIAAKEMAVWYANPNSVHADGRRARKALDEARERIARCINAEPWQIEITPSATAACHYAMASLNIFDCSPYEHKAVYDFCEAIRDFIPSGGYAHMLVNNETGEIYTEQVKELAKEKTVFTDATAAMGHIPIDVKELGVSALAAGAHKFGGPVGVGFLYLRDGTEEDPFPGTPPVNLAVAMSKALEYRVRRMTEYSSELIEYLALGLRRKIYSIPGAHFNCIGKPCLPTIISVRFDGVNARELLSMLDVHGVAASAGAACTADIDKPSRTLLASGLTEEQALSTIRLSFCEETTAEEFDFVGDKLCRSVDLLRRLSR